MLDLRVLSVLFLLTVFLGANWLMDLSMNCMLRNGFLSNGFWEISCNKSFHAIWYLKMASFFGMTILALKTKGEAN